MGLAGLVAARRASITTRGYRRTKYVGGRGYVARVNRTDRLYAIVEELRAASPRPVSVPRLSRRFEVSTRTIERDIQALLQSGLPVYAENGRRGGYVLDRRHTLPPINFTAQEAVAVAAALAGSSGPFAAATRGALLKIQNAMSPPQRARLDELTDRIRLMPQPGPDVPQVIQDALVDREVLELEYVDRFGQPTSRLVEPVAFVQFSGHWHLGCWCRMREGARVFRLDRIREARPTGETAPSRPYADVFADAPATITPDIV